MIKGEWVKCFNWTYWRETWVFLRALDSDPGYGYYEWRYSNAVNNS